MTMSTAVTAAAATACFRTVAEHPDERALSIVGTIPPWLEGVLFRTGPGQFEVGEPDKGGFAIKHWFDGKALNHKFTISGAQSRVLYRSRFACSDQLAREEAQGRPSKPSFAQPYDPCERLYTKFKTAFQSVAGAHDGPTSASDTNVNVVLRLAPDGANLLATTDEVSMQTLDPTTLEPVQAMSYKTFDKRLDGHLVAAHAATIDGMSYNYILKFGPSPFYKIFRMDRNGKCKVLKTIFGAPAAYLHSLAATANHVILSIWQADIGRMGLGVAWKNNVLETILPWSPKRKTVHYIINRFTGHLVRKAVSESFFCFHHINAFETDDGNSIVLDLATFPDTNILQTLKVDAIRHSDARLRPRPEYRRIVLSLCSSAAMPLSIVAPRSPSVAYGFDLPTVNPAFLWRKARFAYGVHSTLDPRSRHLFVDAIIKLDMDHPLLDDKADDDWLKDKDVYRIWKEENMVPSEPIFVPRPQSTAEDDGVILTVALNVSTQESQLVILDAMTMNVVARAGLDCIFPFGFHGLFCPKIPAAAEEESKQ